MNKPNKVNYFHHIEAEKKDIAPSVVIMGDPLRAKYIAENYLDDYKLVNTIRNMFFYTGYFSGVRVTVGAHGMGNASIGIYVQELFEFYDAQVIIRLGSSGAYIEELKLLDLVNVEAAACDNNFAKRLINSDDRLISADPVVVAAIEDCADQLGYKVHNGNCYSEDIFHLEKVDNWRKHVEDFNTIAVEMECSTLFTLAKKFDRQAGAILSIAGSLVKPELGEISNVDKANRLSTLALLGLNTLKHLVELNKEG